MQLLAWVAKLLPRQKNEGAGSVQVGQAGGDVTTTSNVTIINVVAQPIGGQDLPVTLATPAQREVLAMIRKLHNREAVFVFMQRQFGTRMVIDLQPSQLLRVRRYVEVIQSRARGKS